MARQKLIDTSPRFIALDLERRLLPGTFEHALNDLLDHEISLLAFNARYRNDVTGALAYPPAIFLKRMLFAYSQGVVRSRTNERLRSDHSAFIALSGESQPHFTWSPERSIQWPRRIPSWPEHVPLIQKRHTRLKQHCWGMSDLLGHL